MKILLTGGSGLLGANLAFEFARIGHLVTAVYHQHPMHIPHVAAESCNLVDDCAGLIARANPTLIVHCAAATNVEWCEAHPRESMRLNGELPEELAAAAKSAGAQFVYISTDAVFDGSSGGYRETDPVGPINQYARSKVFGEEAVLRQFSDALVLRVNIYGWNLQSKNSLAEWVLSGLRKAQPVPGFDDVSFAPVLVNDIAGWVLHFAAAKAGGVYHLSSRDHMSKYEFAIQVAEVFGFDHRLVQRTLIGNSSLTVQRPRHTWLRNDRTASVLGKPMPSIREGLEKMRTLELSGFVGHLKQAALN